MIIVNIDIIAVENNRHRHYIFLNLVSIIVIGVQFDKIIVYLQLAMCQIHIINMNCNTMEIKIDYYYCFVHISDISNYGSLRFIIVFNKCFMFLSFIRLLLKHYFGLFKQIMENIIQLFDNSTALENNNYQLKHCNMSDHYVSNIIFTKIDSIIIFFINLFNKIWLRVIDYYFVLQKKFGNICEKSI